MIVDHAIVATSVDLYWRHKAYCSRVASSLDLTLQ